MPREATIEVPDETVIDVEIPEELADVLGPDVTTLAPAPAAPAAPAAPKNAADEAAASLTAAMQASENARRAAEAAAEAERQRRMEAERLAAQHQADAQLARQQVHDGRAVAIESEIKVAQADSDAAQADYVAALDAGDFRKAAQAQVKMAAAVAKIDRLTAQKDATVAARPAAAPAEGRVDPVPVATFEQYVRGFAPRSQAWLRLHPDCAPPDVGGDETKNARMMTGHFAAKAAGLKEGSDEYFRVIEEHVDGVPARVSAPAPASPTSAAADVAAAAAPRAPKPRPSAPVSREPPSASGAPGPTTRRVQLNADQMEMALISYPAKPGETDDAHKRRAYAIYAREYLEAKAAGQIGRMSH